MNYERAGAGLVGCCWRRAVWFIPSAMPSSGPRNLILGAIEGYQFPAIGQFFTTLKRAGFDGEVVLFHRNVDEPTLTRIREFGTTLVALPPRGVLNPFTGRRHSGAAGLGRLLRGVNGVLRAAPGGQEMRIRLAIRFFHIANGRYVMAHEFLRKRVSAYKQVLITDVRDVIFQDDPFKGTDPEELSTFLEGPYAIVRREEIFYRKWLETEYGVAETAKWLDRRLACCGLTMGPAARMVEYLGAMTRLLLESRTLEPYRFGLDSAAHNYLLFHNLVPELVTRDVFEGPVATLGTVSGEEVNRHMKEGLRNEDGSLVNIIHQYDRHEACRNLVE